MTSELRNPDTNAAFYVTIHTNSSISTIESFQLHINTSAGSCKNFHWHLKNEADQIVTIPKYAPATVLNGYQSKIIVTDFSFGPNSLLYSTAEVLATALIDNSSTIAFWVPTGESGEIAFKGFLNGTVLSSAVGSSISFNQANGALIVSFTQTAGITVVELNGGKTRVLLMDRTAAYQFWAPSLGSDPSALTDQLGTILERGFVRC